VGIEADDALRIVGGFGAVGAAAALVGADLVLVNDPVEGGPISDDELQRWWEEHNFFDGRQESGLAGTLALTAACQAA
jgi:hypothetical protein